jgi:hypothetical protein
MSTNETKGTILDPLDKNEDPSAEKYNLAVAVANANYMRASHLETGIAEVCAKASDLLGVPREDLSSAVSLLGAIVKLLEERDAAAREAAKAFAERDRVKSQESGWASNLSTAREARDKADAVIDAAWKVIPWAGAVRGMVELSEVVETLLKERDEVRSNLAEERGMKMLVEARLENAEARSSAAIAERIAQISAHRVCISGEHDPQNGKIHGYCVVCGVEWPCYIAMKPSKVEPDEAGHIAGEIVGRIATVLGRGPIFPADRRAQEALVAEVERLKNVEPDRLARQMFSWGVDTGISWAKIGGGQMSPEELTRQFGHAMKRVEKGEWTVQSNTAERQAFVAGINVARRIPDGPHIARHRAVELAFESFKKGEATK